MLRFTSRNGNRERYQASIDLVRNGIWSSCRITTWWLSSRLNPKLEASVITLTTELKKRWAMRRIFGQPIVRVPSNRLKGLGSDISSCSRKHRLHSVLQRESLSNHRSEERRVGKECR